MRPRLLDLFCKAGGAGMGYHRAGFEVVGVDIEPQPNYPFEFVQADALALDPAFVADFDAIHASPPCQAYTGMQRINTRAPKREHPRLIEPTRALLVASGRPYVMENVPGAPLFEPVVLCGSMFGLGVRRHRLFECNFLMLRPSCQHSGKPRPIAVYGDHPQQPGDKTYRVNRARTLGEGLEAMGIDWMGWRELTQAIPPAYTQFIGEHLMRVLQPKPAPRFPGADTCLGVGGFPPVTADPGTLPESPREHHARAAGADQITFHSETNSPGRQRDHA